MSRSNGHIAAMTWLALFGMAGTAVAAPAGQDQAPATQAVTADDARSLQGEGRWEEAAEAWEQVATQEPDNGAAWFNLGYCLHAAGRLEEAIDMHKKAATFDDYHGIAMYNLGCAYALVGRPDDAVHALAEAQDAGFSLRGRVESDSDLQSLRGNPGLGALLQREGPAGWRGKVGQAVAGVRRFLSGPQVSGMLQKLTATAHAALTQLQEKMAGDERFAAIAQKLQGLLGGRGGHGGHSGQAHADERADREPAPASPGDETADEAITLGRAQGYQQAGDWGNAVDAYRAVLVEQPDNPAGWFGLAYCLHMNGDYEQAIEAHKESARFDQTRGIALYNLACAYSLTGRTDEALEALKSSREAGFDIAPARTDSDLDNVREDPRFKAMFRRQ